jgi:hypothetical protein
MRTLTNHIVEGDSANHLRIEVVDEPGQGGASHEYVITTDAIGAHGKGLGYCRISFQNGPVGENGVNGVTQEALLAIVIDRLRSFQAGPFACNENAQALAHAEFALKWLKRRTIERMNRGVEGTDQK